MAGVAAAVVGGVTAVAGIATQVKGMVDASNQRGEAKKAFEAAMAKIKAVGAPPDLSSRIFLEEFKSAGVLTPQMEQDLGKMETAHKNINEDPSLRASQMASLNEMKTTGRIGLSAKSKAALNQIRQTVAKDVEGKRQQIIQNAQQRGMAGSGAELMASFQAAQSGADTASNEGEKLAAEQESLALQARQNALSAAGSIRQDDFAKASALAEASDRATQFNMSNSMARQQRNTDRYNLTSAANLQNQQNINNANTSMRNAETERANTAKRTFWQDKVNMAQLEGGMDQANANRLSADAANTGASAAAMGGALLNAGATVYSSMDTGKKPTGATNEAQPAKGPDYANAPFEVDTSVNYNDEYDKILKKGTTG